MRLVSYARADGALTGGVLVDDVVVDLAEAARRAGSAAVAGTGSVRAAVAAPAAELERIHAAAGELAAASGAHPLDAVELGPPVPDPDKILCLGLNYVDHAAETELEVPAAPVLFPKFRNSLSGPAAPIVVPPAAREVDYEGELALVISRRAKDVPPEAALDHVAGFMAFNDVSARDLQMLTSQWTAGKAIDGFAPCGPALVLRDEVPDHTRLEIVTRVNGVELQRARAAEMLFPIPETIAFVSSLITLEPGDVIATGTPAGVGFTRTPPVLLSDGDVVEVSIDGLGTLRNRVVDPTGAAAAAGVPA